jgi:cob(I)alamin adenosyltransferase
MKKLYIFTILIFLLNIASAQKIEYPRYDVDSLGNTVVIMTVEQAQKLDNSVELLLLLEKLNSQSQDYDIICIKTINDLNNIISIQKIEISKLKEYLKNKDEQILTLLSEASAYEKKVNILEQEVSNRQGVIDEKDKQIKNLKTKIIIGGVGGGVAITGLILFILFGG